MASENSALQPGSEKVDPFYWAPSALGELTPINSRGMYGQARSVGPAQQEHCEPQTSSNMNSSGSSQPAAYTANAVLRGPKAVKNRMEKLGAGRCVLAMAQALVMKNGPASRP
jgi:hypothetical protein